MELPKKFPEQRAAVLRIFSSRKGVILREEEVTSQLEERFRHNVAKLLDNLKGQGMLEGGKVAGYKMTSYGFFVLKNLDNIVLSPFSGPRPYVKRNYTKRVKSEPATPQPIPINISTTADNLANHISALIEENAQYRALMLNLIKTLITAMGLTDINSLANTLGMEVQTNDKRSTD